MTIKSDELIADLMERTTAHIRQAESLIQESPEDLNWKSEPGRWSVLECIEHLNLYGDFYLPEIERSMNKNNTTAVSDFKSGIVGNYFAKLMLPKEKMNKMKTFKDKDPAGSRLDKGCIDRFMGQQRKMLELLEQAKKINLSKTKASMSITKWIKLKLGDTFRVVIYHNERHLVQAMNVLRGKE